MLSRAEQVDQKYEGFTKSMQIVTLKSNIMSSTKSRKVWLGFIFSLFSTMLNGFDLGFNVYAIELKDTFKMSQLQVGTTSSFCTVGLILGCLQGTINEKLGSKTTFISLWLISTTSAGLFSLVSFYKEEVQHYLSVIYSIQFLLSASLNMIHMAAARVYLRLFTEKHSAKVEGLYYTMYCVGKIGFTGMFQLFFEKHLAEFFLVICVLTVLLVSPCLLLLYLVSKDPNYAPEYETMSESETSKNNDSTSGRRMYRSLFFQITCVCAVIFFGLNRCCLISLTAIARSAGLNEPLLPIYITSGFMLIFRLASGFTLNKVGTEFFGFVTLLIGITSFLICTVIGIFCLNGNTVLVFSAFLGVSQGVAFVAPVFIIVNRFGKLHYADIVNGVFFVGCLFQIPAQILMGYVYETNIRPQAETKTCYGKYCFRDQFLILFVLTATIGVVQLSNCIVSIIKHNKT